MRWFLCSDLHIGHVAFDRTRLDRELTRACELDAHIFLNGDVFDAIATRDKRNTPGQTIPDLALARDKTQAAAHIAANILRPYREHIRVIGSGNHEMTWVKHQESDPIAALITLLMDGRKHPEPIRHGGIAGYITTYLDVPSGEGKPLSLRHKLLYHHGTGGDSPVTLGTIDMNRKAVRFAYDCYTFGHKHNKLVMDDVLVDVGPTGQIIERERKAIQTGSYFRNLRRTTQKNPLDFTYAEESQHSAKPLGGMFLVLTPVNEMHRGKSRWRIQQDSHSALMPGIAKAIA